MNANANSPLTLRIRADGEGKPLPLGLSGFPTEADGVPISYRKVKLARVGNWTHRGTGEPVTITPDRVDEWVRNTKALSAAGVNPFLPNAHRAEFSAADNNGYLVDVARDGDDLFGVFALYGDDALKRAAVNGRSIYVVADARDAKGNVYKGESIAHVALVPNPALPDLGPTVKIAASAGGSPVEAPILEPATPQNRSSPMFKPETADKLRAKFQGTKAAKLTDDELAEMVAAAALADPPPDKTAEVAALSADKTRLEGELAAEKSKVLSLSANAPKQPDPEILRDRADIYASRIDLMTERGDMPKFVADKLKAKVAPTAVLMLSASADFDNKRPIDFVLSLFDGAKLGIQAGNPVNRSTVAQPLALSGDAGEKTLDQVREEARKEGEAYQAAQLRARGLQPAGA